MPSQEQRRRKSIPESQVMGRRSQVTETMIRELIASGTLPRDVVITITGDYTVDPTDLGHIVLMYDVSGDNGDHTLTLPPTEGAGGMRIILRVYGTLPTPWSLTVATQGSDTLINGSAVTAIPATRVYYPHGDEWHQVLAEDPVEAEDPVYLTARAVCLSNMDLTGTETEDGVTFSADELAFCIGQTTAHQNGLWVVKTTGWVRPDGWAPQPNDQIRIEEGSVFKDTIWQLANDTAPTLGTDSQTWKRIDQRLVTIHGTDASATIKDGLGRLRYSFPNLTTNTRVLTLPRATGNDGQEVLVQIEFNVGATRFITIATQGTELLNGTPTTLTGPWASALFVARAGNWNRMNL